MFLHRTTLSNLWHTRLNCYFITMPLLGFNLSDTQRLCNTQLAFLQFAQHMLIQFAISQNPMFSSMIAPWFLNLSHCIISYFSNLTLSTSPLLDPLNLHPIDFVFANFQLIRDTFFQILCNQYYICKQHTPWSSILNIYC